MEKTKVYKNDSKVDQIFYNRHGDPIFLRPGQSFTEDLSGAFDLADWVSKETQRKQTEGDADELKRVKKQIALIKATRTLEQLDKLAEGETNQMVLDVILEKKKEIVDGDPSRDRQKNE